MSSVYLQLPLADASQKYVTVNTHLGLFCYHRLPFGVSAAPAVFQRYMETLLRGLPGTAVYLDDILITGATVEEHIQNLEAVLTKLHKAGLKLNRSKCSFLKTRIEYLGHIICAAGSIQVQRNSLLLKKLLLLKILQSFMHLLGYLIITVGSYQTFHQS